ncbi:2-oxoglutarate and iron-dependent oxygenase domain-containing protein [soil metagenome]
MPRTTPAARSALPLPVIDLALLRSSDIAQRRLAAAELRAACEDRGFFYVRNHGVEAALIDALYEQSRSFFDQHDDTKRSIDKALSPCNRGYEPLRNQTLEAGAPPDVKEGYYMSVDLPASDPRAVAGKFNHGPNQWPAGRPEFKRVTSTYYERMSDLGALLMSGLALSLELPEEHFAGLLTNVMSNLRLLHYPPQPPRALPGEKGCGEHTDFGSITLLSQDSVGGLQVWDAATGEWIDAPPVPGTYIVNIGDLMARWTNDRYHSTLHRVVNTSGRERYSVAFFLGGAPDHIVECLPGCLGEGESPRYAPVTVEQHVAECYARSYGKPIREAATA